MGPQAAFEWLDHNETVYPKQVGQLRYDLWKFDGYARDKDYARFALHQLAESNQRIEALQQQTAKLIELAKDQSGLLQAINNSAYSSARVLKDSEKSESPEKQFTVMTTLLNGIRWATYVSFGALVYIAAVLVNRLH